MAPPIDRDEADAGASGAMPTQADSPSGRRRDATAPGLPSLSAFDPPPKRFETRGELGRGGMGRVEDAFDRALGRQVAIKHILSESSVDLARFEREARITARLEHPAIVPVHDAGRSADGTPYYVMRHVDGRPLDELIRDRPLAARLALVPNVLAVCDAMGYAHARGIVHRDVKPSNILVGPFGETLLIDWGLAREIGAPAAGDSLDPDLGPDAGAALAGGDGSLTVAGVVAGTPGFMAPEQARGETVDARADVFALGATLFHVLAGRPPYASPSATEMIHAVSTDRPPEWARIPRDVPADLLAIVHKAMASDADARYADAGAMAADLRRFVTGQLVAAHAYGWREQLSRFGRKNRAALAVGAGALVVLGVIAVLSFQRIVAERDHAAAAFVLAEQQRRDTVDLRDGLLVDQAADLASRDPIAAIALLRQLPPESSRWPQAYAAASTAFFHGIPSGFELDPDGLTSLVASPDNRHAVASTSGGAYVAIDLVARTQRVLATGRRGTCAFVRGGTHVLCSTSGTEVELFEVATGAREAFTIPADAQIATTDGAQRAWLRVAGDLYEVALDRAPISVPAEPIARGAGVVLWESGAKRLVIQLPTEIQIRGDGRTWTLPHRGQAALAVEDGAQVVLSIDDHYEVWDLSGEPVSRWRVASDPRELPVALVDDIVYATDGATMHGHRRNGTSWTLPVGAVYGTTPSSLLATEPGGGILVRDHAGTFHLGKRPLGYARLTLTPDHRFLVAGTAEGVVTWFDLAPLRPTMIATPESEYPRYLGRYLWTVATMHGISRYDLDTGAVVRHDVGGFVSAAFDPGERYVALALPHELRIVDFETNQVVFQGSGVDDWMFGDLGLVVAVAGQLSRAAAPGFEVHKLATLPAQPTAMLQRAGLVLAMTPAQTCRVTTAGAVTCIALPAATDAPATLALDPGGRAWMTLAGALYRWDVGGAAWQLQPLEQRVSGLAIVDDRTIAYSNGSLIVLDDPPRSIAVPRVTEVAGRHGLVIYATNDDGLALADLAAGTTIQIPTRGHLPGQVTDGHRIVASARSESFGLDVLTLSVPREPAALRAWLETVTNARRTHAGIVSFP